MKMKSKLLSIFVLFILCNNSGFAQATTTYTDNLTKLTVWLSDIDSVMVRVSDGEKLKKISRQFSYVMETVENIVSGEKDLSESLSKRSEINNENTVQLQPLVTQIAGDIDQLSDRIKKIKADVSEKDKLILDPIVNSFNEISQNKDTIQLNYLTSYLYGEKNVENKLKGEAKYAKDLTEKLVEKLNEAKAKIKAKVPR